MRPASLVELNFYCTLLPFHPQHILNQKEWLCRIQLIKISKTRTAI